LNSTDSQADRLFSERCCDQIADALVERGYVCVAEAFTATLVAQLRAEFDHPHCNFKTAGIGRGDEYTQMRHIRGDRICWLEGESPAPKQFLAGMSQLREALNYRLFMGLFDYESHLAYYPTGSFYRRHVDAFRGRSNRVLSTVAYLNQDWPADAGGELVLYSAEGECELERISPQGGRLVIFLSERFPHEVLPARLPRYSIAGWFRVNSNTAQVIDPPR